MKVIRAVLWQCEPTVAAFSVDTAAWTSIETLAVEDLTPRDAERKTLRIHTVAGEDVGYVTCMLNRRGTFVEFLAPRLMTDAQAVRLEQFVTHTLARAERDRLVRPEVGFRPRRV